MDVSRELAFCTQVSTLRNDDEERNAMTVGTLDDYAKSKWYGHMSFEIIREYHEDYRYPVNMKVHSCAKAFADRWDQFAYCRLVYNSDSRIHENCFVVSH